jgi:hypothetical protein
MTQRQLGVDLVVIPPAGAGSLEVLGFLEVGNNALDGALGNPNLNSDLAQRSVRVARNCQ